MSDEEEYSDYGEEGDEELGEEEEGGQEEADEGEEEQEEEEEKEPEDPPNPLTTEFMHESLGLLSRIGPGLSHAYIKSDLSHRELTDIELMKTYIHLRDVNISNNFIRDITPLNSMPNLTLLNASSNKVAALELDVFPYLQRANFDNNRCKTMEGMSHPMLERLSVEFNEIERFYMPDPSKLSNLKVLDLRGNRLTTASGVYPPNLQELYLASNLINDLSRMEGLDNLRVLHLRDNQLSTLDSITQSNFPSLTYINIRGNLVEELTEVKHLQCLAKLSAVVLQENPFQDNCDDYRIEVWAALDARTSIYRLDKDPFDEDELNDAEELKEKWKVEEEEANAAAAAAEEERIKELEQEQEQQEQQSNAENTNTT